MKILGGIRHLETQDLAKEWGVVISTVTRTIRRENLPAFKIGQKFYIREESYRDWLKDRDMKGRRQFHPASKRKAEKQRNVA